MVGENKTRLFVFDKALLLSLLQQLSKKERSAFAAACAHRLLPFYQAFSMRAGRGNPKELSDLLERLWDDLTEAPMSETELTARIQTCMILIPREDDGPWIFEQRLGDDAATAVAYALRCRKNGLAQEAAWAAERAYEAVMYFCQKADLSGQQRNPRLVTRSQAQVEIRRRTEEPIVQNELRRQQRDLEELLNKEVPLAHLRERSAAQDARNAIPE